MNRNLPSACFAIKTLSAEMRSDPGLKPLINVETDGAAFSLLGVRQTPSGLNLSE